jgi:hypothetical protein
MSEHNLLDLYDLAKEGESAHKWFSHYEPPFGVAAMDGTVDVWLVEDTDVETNIDPRTMTARQFHDAVFEFVDSTQEN